MPQRSFRQGGNPEPLVAGSLHEPLASQPVKRVPHRRDAGIEVVGKKGGLEPVARAIQPAAQLLLYRSVNALEGAGPVHTAGLATRLPGQSWSRTNAATSSSWSGRKASLAASLSGTSSCSRTEGHWPSKFPRFGRCCV